jgi:N-acetyl sugar amidotransferase
MKKINFCKRCVYPSIAVNVDFDDDGICTSCQVFEEIEQIPKEVWSKRKEKFVQILEEHRKITQGDYDCIIPVGGGKDSYWQVHVIKDLGFEPLLVTYHGNNYLPEGQRNLDHMKEAFNCDHYVFSPGVETLIKMNRAGFKMMGDMNWHNHAGILSVPNQCAVNFKVPLVIWGEVAWDISGMFSPDDYVEFNKRTVFEHDMRGFSRDSFIGKEGLTKREMKWCKLPTDEEWSKNKIKGIYIGNFINWDPNYQTDVIIEMYDWESARLPFERTYRMFSNLDDMHENGIHDYMKWIKFGYGRCSDHVSKDIRTGYMTRDEGVELVKKYDHVKPMRDLNRWLEYVDLSEGEFDEIADGFRDSRVWQKNSSGNWTKENVWDLGARKGIL